MRPGGSPVRAIDPKDVAARVRRSTSGGQFPGVGSHGHGRALWKRSANKRRGDLQAALSAAGQRPIQTSAPLRQDIEKDQGNLADSGTRPDQ